jgi:hypothetical protein
MAEPGDRFLIDDEVNNSFFGEIVRERDGWAGIAWILGTSDRVTVYRGVTYQCAVDAVERYKAAASED